MAPGPKDKRFDSSSNNLPATFGPSGLRLPLKSEVFNLMAQDSEPESILIKNVSARNVADILGFMGYSISDEFIDHIFEAIKNPDCFDPETLRSLYVSHGDLPLSIERTQVLQVGNNQYYYAPSLMEVLLEGGTYRDTKIYLNPPSKDGGKLINLTIDFKIAGASASETWALLESLSGELIEEHINFKEIDMSQHTIENHPDGALVATISNRLSIVITPGREELKDAGSLNTNSEKFSKTKAIADKMRTDLRCDPDISKQDKLIPVSFELHDVPADKWRQIFEALDCQTLSNEGRAIVPYLVSITEGAQELDGESAQIFQDKLNEKLDIKVIHSLFLGEDPELSDLGIEEEEGSDDDLEGLSFKDSERLRELEEEYLNDESLLDRSPEDDEDLVSGAQICVSGMTCPFADIDIIINKYPNSVFDREVDVFRKPDSKEDDSAQSGNEIFSSSYIQISFEPNGSKDPERHTMAWSAIDKVCKILGQRPIANRIRQNDYSKFPATNEVFAVPTGSILVLVERDRSES